MLKSCRRVEVMKNVEVVKKSRGRAKKKMLRNRRWHYGGPQLSKEKTSRQKKKTHGKRKNLTAKRKRLTAKEKTSQQKKKPHGKKKRLTAKEKKTSQPLRSLLCREDIVISFAVRLFLSPWVFYLDKPDNDMRTNYLTSVIIAQCLQKLYLPITVQS